MAEKADYKEIITEYKDQIRILKDEVDEMQSKLKEKDSALKRTSLKYEFVVEDLDKANSEIKTLQEKIKILKGKPSKILTPQTL